MSIVALLTDGDQNSAWGVSTGAARFSLVNDNSDATYITSPSQGTSVYQGMTLGTTTLTATQRIKAVQFIMRYVFTTAGYVQLRFVSSGQTASKAAITHQRASAGSIKTSTSAWFTRDAANKEWKQAQLDSLAVRLYGANAAGAVRVHEVDVSVDVRNQPTLATPTVTDNTSSSRPTVTWVFADSDGDPQIGWQVKAFTAAQYGAAGFDPSSSPFAWSSGEVLNDAQNVTIDTDLTNGVTYKAYVRLAKDFNGARWYSDWVPSAAFTMGFEPVPQPTITVTADNTVPHLRNLITVDSKMNLLISNDASFESGLGGWVALANCAIVQDATQFLKGVKSMRLTATVGATDMTARTLSGTGAYPAAAGVAYTLLAAFRAALATPRSCRLEARFYDGGGVQVGADAVGGNVTDSNAAWTQATLVATAPAGALFVDVRVRVLIPGAGEQHFVDAVSLSPSSSTTWFTGGVAQIDSQLVEFTDLSPQHSVVVNLLNPQVASGGELVGNTDGFFKRFVEDLLDLDRSPLDAPSAGEAVLAWTVGRAAFSALDFATPNGGYDPTYTPPGLAGVAQTMSIWCKARTGTHSCKLFVYPIDGSGAQVGAGTEVNTGAQTVDTTWRRLQVAITPPAGTVGLRPAFENTNGDLVTYLFDGLQLELGSTATGWHQGQGQIPAWQPVRGAKTALMADGRTNLAQVWDREAPPGVIRMYRATNTVAYADGTTGVGPVSTMVTTRLAIPTDSNILKDPEQPAHDMVVSIRSLSHSISEDLTVFHPVRPNALGPEGFGQRPIIASDWIGGQDGQMELQIWDEADWYRLQQLLQTKRALLLQLAEGGQRYIRFQDRSWPLERIQPVGGAAVPSRYLRVVAVNFAQVARPAVLA